MDAKFELRLINRMKEILSGDGHITLTHDNGIKEGLIVGESNGCVYVYNTEPDLIAAFEIEGGPDAKELNIRDAAIWLYKCSHYDNKISEK
jgi:hypothetical protein